MLFSGLFKALAGRPYRRFDKKATATVVRINEIEEQYQQLSDDELKAKTPEFMERVQNGESLDDLLPEAFAAVKNTARRLCGQTIEVRGQQMEWNMVHFDVQLKGGMALHQGMIAEMATGEGKTLVATLPLYLNALSGRNCQLVTVNEYLAQRDAEWMGYIYRFLGLTVGVIRNGQSPPEKREAYGANITYGTSSEFGFDYLRDNGMASRKEDQVQRDHYFTIIDEVDSILVDEARTPLIISGPVQEEREAPFRELKQPIQRIVREQSNLCNRAISEARSLLRDQENSEEGSKDRNAERERYDRAFEKMLLVKMGMPKNKQFLRLLEDNTIRKEFEAFDLEMGADFNKTRRFALKEQLFYTIEEKQHTADLTENGRNFLRPNDDEAFMLPDLPTLYMEIDKSDAEQADKDKRKAEAQKRFEAASEEIHVISQLLRAYSLYEKDDQYVVQEGKVMIVDENTGRVMPGRRWSDGLHQAIEAKENVNIEKESRTYATITIQNYFRLYDKLAGMTGTAETEANEFFDIYRLKVMVIPTNKPCVRDDLNDIIFKTRREKYAAVMEDIKERNATGQPILIGTTTVESSEILSRYLRRERITHSVLNAKYHQQEAEIVARAGQRGAVTIATNMAGRGTDIRLGEGIEELGGLYVLGTERHTSRRIDRQLRGRCARQGDPGVTRFYLSLEDDLMRLYGRGFAGKMLESSFEEGQPLEHAWLNPAIERAQKTVEQHHYTTRKRLLQYDDVLNKQREVVYGIRNDAIHSDEPRSTLFEMIDEEVDFRFDDAGLVEGQEVDAEMAETFLTWANTTFPIGLGDDQTEGLSASELKARVNEKIREAYQTKEAAEEEDALKNLERYVIIRAIDRHWQNHLTEMEELRQAVGLRGYGQKDPLNEYKTEAFTFFEQMMGSIRADICTGIFRSATNVEAFQNMLRLLSRNAKTVGPSGQPPAGLPATATTGGQTAPGQPAQAATGARQRRPATAGAHGGRPGGRPARQPGARPGSEIQLPKVQQRAPELPRVGRNEVVTIRKGQEVREVKFKKAQPMIEKEGWQLVRKR